MPNLINKQFGNCPEVQELSSMLSRSPGPAQGDKSFLKKLLFGFSPVIALFVLAKMNLLLGVSCAFYRGVVHSTMRLRELIKQH